ncbi:zinc finger, CCHC-type containing protein [Tanacetum coccineum]
MDLTKAGANMFLQINELDELRLDAYESSISYKERMKRWHDKRIRPPTEYEKEIRLGLICRKKQQTTETLHQILEEVVHTECGDGVTSFKRRHHDQVINWLDRLPAGSISTWDDLTTHFLTQFFPPGRTAKLRNDILMFQQHQDESIYNAYNRFKELLRKVPHHGSPDYIDANLEHELESMECRVESLMRNEVLLYYEGGFTFPKRPYQEEFEGRILKLIDDQEDQIRQLEENMRKIKDTFMCFADRLITTLKVKIEAQQAHSIKIEKITTFPTHTPTVTPETLKLAMVHRVSMISKFKPTIYRTPHRHLNSNLKMAILHSFEENKLEYEDEDEVEIKMMGTRMDKESLKHNLHENDITPIICHNFSPTSNPPIKPKDSGSFRMKEFLKKEKIFFIDPGDSVRINPDGIATPATGKFDFI